jgi:hypothetical protein
MKPSRNHPPKTGKTTSASPQVLRKAVGVLFDAWNFVKRPDNGGESPSATGRLPLRIAYDIAKVMPALGSADGQVSTDDHR